MHHTEKMNEKENYCDCDDCNCGQDCCCSEEENCDECGCKNGVCYCCSPRHEMTKETAKAMLTKVATDVWMKLFWEACEKEMKKTEGKKIQKLAAEHVKKAIKEWNEKMN